MFRVVLLAQGLINQQISSKFDGFNALWPAAPPEPRGSGSSTNCKEQWFHYPPASIIILKSPSFGMLYS